MAFLAQKFNLIRFVTIAAVPFTLFGYSIPLLPASAQVCDPSITSCLDQGTASNSSSSSTFSPSEPSAGEDGGMTGINGTSSLGDAPNQSVSPPVPTAPSYTSQDQCLDRAEASFLKCTDSLGSDTAKGAVAGATAGFTLGGGPFAPPLSGAGAALGGVVGGTGGAVGNAVYCGGSYVYDVAKCDSQ